MSLITGNPTNAVRTRPAYIPSLPLRDKVNAHLDLMASIALQAKQGAKGAEANYHRAAAQLMDMRPALTTEDANRQRINAAHLRLLADRIDRGLVPLEMVDEHRAAA